MTSRPSMAAKMQFLLYETYEKHITANYPFYMVSIDLEKAIDQVPFHKMSSEGQCTRQK